MMPMRPWSDLCPDLLNSIYYRLPPPPAAGRMEFSSVCKNWRHHISPVSSPPPLKHSLMSLLDVLDDAEIPSETHKELSRSYVKYTWPGSAWWLLSSTDSGGIWCVFNPTFRWPTSFVRLPLLPHSVSQPPLKAAFSAPPTDPEWTIFLVRGHASFSAFTCGRLRWDNYSYRGGKEEGGQYRRRVCEGIGYREGSFFCLFDTGDVFIFGIDNGTGELMRSMLVAVASPPVMLARQDHLRVVAAKELWDGKFLVMSWGRRRGGCSGSDGGSSSSLRLVSVERETAKELRQGQRWGSDILVREQPGRNLEGTRTSPSVANINVFFCLVFVLLILDLCFLGML